MVSKYGYFLASGGGETHGDWHLSTLAQNLFMDLGFWCSYLDHKGEAHLTPWSDYVGVSIWEDELGVRTTRLVYIDIFNRKHPSLVRDL